MFQFPQLRVRYMPATRSDGCTSLFQFPQLRVRYTLNSITYADPIQFQFPQLRVRYSAPSANGAGPSKVSIPAVAGKIHAKITKAHCISAAQFVQLSIFASFIIEEV